MIKKIQIDLISAAFKMLRLLLAVTIWSCHVWIAPAFRFCRGSDDEPYLQRRGSTLKFLNPRPRSRNKFGMVEAKTNSHVMLNLIQHPVCFFSAFSKRDLNKPSNPRPLDPFNSSGFTLIEVIAVMIIVGILAATLLPKINFGSISTTASAAGAANMRNGTGIP